MDTLTRPSPHNDNVVEGLFANRNGIRTAFYDYYNSYNIFHIPVCR